MTEASEESSQAHAGRTESRAWLRPLLLGALLLLLWGTLCRFLAIEWSINEQYSYGWFVPFFALYLFWTRWENRPPAVTGASRGAPLLAIALAAAALLLLLPLRLFEVANPDWRLLGWLHTAAAATLTLLFLWRAGGFPWVSHFAFPVGFFFVAVPWILALENPVVQGLMRLAAMAATEAAGLSGIPAQVEGNLIRVNTGVVGVNEACSGVRSLQTSLMIGLLFGDLARLSPLRRLWLVVGAACIAVLGNFGRAFFLVWVAATDSPAAMDRWHDTAGYAILGAVFLGSVALVALLSRSQRRSRDAARVEPAPEQRAASAVGAALPLKPIAVAFCWVLAVEIGVEAWFRAHEGDLVTQSRWTARLPGPEVNGRQVPIDEGVKRILRFDEGGQASWPIAFGSGSPGLAQLFFFRWEPGSTSILRARGHRPDICLPSAGWKPVADHGLRFYRAGDNFALPFRHYTFVREIPGLPRAFTHAFFCIYEDRVRTGTANADPTISTVTPSMLEERMEVVAQGLRNPGQQVLQLAIFSREEKPAAEVEAQFSTLLPSLIQLEDAPAVAQAR